MRKIDLGKFGYNFRVLRPWGPHPDLRHEMFRQARKRKPTQQTGIEPMLSGASFHVFPVVRKIDCEGLGPSVAILRF